MKNKSIRYSFIIAFVLWLLPFLIRIFFVEIPEINIDHVENKTVDSQNIVSEIMQSFSNNDTKHAFVLILKNNLKGCVLNIAGGVTFGLGTLVNLVINGFFSADVFANSYKAGMSIRSILDVTLPHCFELIGFWLSGAIGFYIAWNIIQVMRGKEGFTSHFYKTIGIYSLFIFFIILLAAYVEAYISVNNIK
jgi:uncharacterized membrane protein SpoIIM required for sporulation